MLSIGRHHRLYGLLQGHWDLEPLPNNEGKPAAPNTGEIVAVGADGSFATVVSGLNQPTSLELVGRVGFRGYALWNDPADRPVLSRLESRIRNCWSRPLTEEATAAGRQDRARPPKPAYRRPAVQDRRHHLHPVQRIVE